MRATALSRVSPAAVGGHGEQQLLRGEPSARSFCSTGPTIVWMFCGRRRSSSRCGAGSWRRLNSRCSGEPSKPNCDVVGDGELNQLLQLGRRKLGRDVYAQEARSKSQPSAKQYMLLGISKLCNGTMFDIKLNYFVSG